MRKIISVLLSLCLLCLLAVSVSADVIWEPYGDSFYDDHRDEMQHVNRGYIAGADLLYYTAPNGDIIIGDSIIYADELFNVQYTYEDENGVLWGNCYLRDAENDSAWVDLSGCVCPYNRADFTADYENEFVKAETQPDASFYEKEVLLYDYPGAPESLEALVVNTEADYLPEYNHTYTDPNGNVWAELFYYMGFRGWILLNGDISTAVRPAKAEDVIVTATVEITSEDAENTSEAPTSEEPVVSTPIAKTNALPVLLVVAVVAVTLAVLFVFFRKKKK